MPGKLPKISIITPSLNQGKFIERTIKSVLDQKYPQLEYIVMDGGSTDQTLRILKKYKSRLTYFTGPDKGQSDAINRGLTMATGDIVAYINSDDYYLPGTFDYITRAFSEKKAKWIIGMCRNVDTNGKKTRNYVSLWKGLWYRFPFPVKFKSNILYILNFIPQPAVFWKRSAMKKIGFFDVSLNFAMDYDFFIRLFKYSSPVITKRELASYTIQKQAKRFRFSKESFNESLKVAKRYTSSPVFLTLHYLHDLLAYRIYINSSQ